MIASRIVVPRTGRLPLVTTRLRRPGQHIACALGITAAELAAGKQELLGGVGGTVARAMGVQLHLLVGPRSPDLIELADAWVLFTPALLPGGVDLLLGQHDALERLTFAQLNHAPRRFFVLHHPVTKR